MRLWPVRLCGYVLGLVVVSEDELARAVEAHMREARRD